MPLRRGSDARKSTGDDRPGGSLLPPRTSFTTEFLLRGPWDRRRAFERNEYRPQASVRAPDANGRGGTGVHEGSNRRGRTRRPRGVGLGRPEERAVRANTLPLRREAPWPLV